MKISELATKTRVPAKTIRYYETAGLLSAPVREANGYRYYSSDDIDTLVFIRRCRELNIPLEEIKQLVAAQRNPEASCDTIDNIIAEQLVRVRQTRQELAQLEHTLAMLATSCSNKQIQHCAILQRLKAD